MVGCHLDVAGIEGPAHFGLDYLHLLRGVLVDHDIVDALGGVLGRECEFIRRKNRPVLFHVGDGGTFRQGVEIAAQNDRLAGAAVMIRRPVADLLGLGELGIAGFMVEMSRAEHEILELARTGMAGLSRGIENVTFLP